MNFSILSDRHTIWRDILVIGKTIEQDSQNCHILGMTLSDGAKLYIIEPYDKREPVNRKGVRNHRRMLKEHEEQSRSNLHCSCFYLGSRKLQVQGGTGTPLEYAADDYGIIQLFLDMMSAGWTVPEWLKEAGWDSLQLVALDIADIDTLPEYAPQMPVTITHRPDAIQHILEKTITLHVGKSRSFSFMDDDGDNVQCHINQVMLIDVWKNTKEQFQNPKLAERFSPEQLEEARKRSYDTLEQCCPKGMCYIGIEYECSKNYNLVFHSKQYLKSRPETHQGSACFHLIRLKPDKETGAHGLVLKGSVINTPFSPDTAKIPAELFLYYEHVPEWSETFL